MDIGVLHESVAAFRRTLDETRAKVAPNFPWYPYDTLANFQHLDSLLREHRDLSQLAGGLPVADIGGADGECAFFLETLGFEARLVENPATNFNGLEGARALREALGSRVAIHEVDLDRHFSLPAERYGLVLFFGLLYHLKNPYYALEALSRRTRHVLLSTRVARFSPDGATALADLPIAYLVGERELNDDPTNFWIFSETGLRRLVARTGWELCEYMTIGDTVRSDPVSMQNDERAFCLLRSTGS